MRSSPVQTLLTILLLALLLAPEGVLLHRCACGRILDCCCRTKFRTGESCKLHHSMPHCSAGGGSEEAPSSLQSRQAPLDRFGAALAGAPEIHLEIAGRLSGGSPERLAGLLPKPPVPPPRIV
jgi:hypothetical protein